MGEAVNNCMMVIIVYATMDFIYVYQVTVPDYKTLIPKDIEQAKYWWKKSAAQGNEQAKERLQKIYE